MRRRFLPHPYLSATLAGVWLVLADKVGLGTLIVAAALALGIPLYTARWWPGRPRIASPLGLLSYAFLVLWDVIVANFQVARIILFLPADLIRSAWITVPVELKSPEAVALLAGTITMTPGTLTADYSACGKALLIHALHAPDPDAVVRNIKTRYEARLQRIFS